MKLIIFGASEIAACAYEYFTYDSEYEVVAFTVDDIHRHSKESFMNLPLIPFEQLTHLYKPEHFAAFAAVGSQQLNRVRTTKYIALKQAGYRIASYISSKAFVWRNVEIGEHAFILEDNTLQPFACIGNNVTLWSGNHIGHSTHINDNCFITSHVVISGCCTIGKNTFIGVNSAIAEGVNIAADNFIGMQCKMDQSTTENQLIVAEQSKYSKVPAKRFCRIPLDAY